VIDRAAGKIDVRVHQLVKSLGGDVLSESEVWHFFTTADGLIERMDLEESESEGLGRPGNVQKLQHTEITTMKSARVRECEGSQGGMREAVSQAV
jgi:hypothetical protein